MKPAFKIVANSSNITSLVADRLVSLEISDRAGVRSDRATITLDDRDQRLEIPRTGAELEISLGYVGQGLVRMGKFVVDEVELEGPLRQMVIRANAANMTGGIKAPRERSWPQTNLGEVVRTIAKDHKLSASIPSALASRNLGHLDQCESDMQFLSRVCAEEGATFKVADGRLIVAVRAAGETASGQNMPAVILNANNCERWTATFSERGKYACVIACWHDSSAGTRMEVRAGSGTPEMTLKHSYKTEEKAKRAAQSKLDAMGRGTRSVSISGYVGDPQMAAERVATLVGFRSGVDGSDWVVNEVTHNLSDSGYTCSISLESKQ